MGYTIKFQKLTPYLNDNKVFIENLINQIEFNLNQKYENEVVKPSFWAKICSYFISGLIGMLLAIGIFSLKWQINKKS